MSTPQRAPPPAGVPLATAAGLDKRPPQLPPLGLTTWQDWCLLADALMWHMRRQCDEPRTTPAMQASTMRDCARLLHELRASQAGTDEGAADHPVGHAVDQSVHGGASAVATGACCWRHPALAAPDRTAAARPVGGAGRLRR